MQSQARQARIELMSDDLFASLAILPLLPPIPHQVKPTLTSKEENRCFMLCYCPVLLRRMEGYNGVC